MQFTMGMQSMYYFTWYNRLCAVKIHIYVRCKAWICAIHGLQFMDCTMQNVDMCFVQAILGLSANCAVRESHKQCCNSHNSFIKYSTRLPETFIYSICISEQEATPKSPK